MSKAQTEERLHELDAAERPESLETGRDRWGEVGKESDLKLAHDHLVAETME